MFVEQAVDFQDIKGIIEKFCDIFNMPMPEIRMALLKETEESVTDKLIVVNLVTRNGLPVEIPSAMHAVNLLAIYMCKLSVIDDHIPKVVTQLVMHWWKSLEDEMK